jgi:leader peptidase (prepilin peptidase)/N-methyltransferase
MLWLVVDDRKDRPLTQRNKRLRKITRNEKGRVIIMADTILKLVLGVLLLICSVQDIRKKKIHLWVIVIGGLLAIGCLPFCEALSLLNRLGGGMIGLGVILISIASKGKIGIGDGILLCITGIGLGFWANLELFGIALFFAAMLSILLLVFRFADRKKSIPFVPFLLIGFTFLFLVTKGTML